MLHIYHCGCVDDQYLSPYQTRANWLPWLLRKSGPLILIFWAPGAHILQIMGLIYHCGCVDDQYLSPYQTRANWLPWLLRKSGPLILIYWAPGGHILQTMGLIYPLWVCGWSIPITIPNQSHVAALVAKKKRALDINDIGPLGPTYFKLWGLFTIVGVSMINTYHYTKPEPRGCLGLLRKSGPLILSYYGPLRPSTFVFRAKFVTGFYPRNMAHKCAKFGPWGYFSFWGRGGQRNLN